MHRREEPVLAPGSGSRHDGTVLSTLPPWRPQGRFLARQCLVTRFWHRATIGSVARWQDVHGVSKAQELPMFPRRPTARLAPLTLLVGDNSTGKTSFMAMIRVLWELAWQFKIPDFKEEPYDLGSFDEVAHHRGRRGGRAEMFEAGFEATPSRPKAARKTDCPHNSSVFSFAFAVLCNISGIQASYRVSPLGSLRHRIVGEVWRFGRPALWPCAGLRCDGCCLDRPGRQAAAGILVGSIPCFLSILIQRGALRWTMAAS